MGRALQVLQRLLHEGRPRPPLSPASILDVLAAVYGGAAALRAGLYGSGRLVPRRLPIPVVSVGNLTVGGTGKTPVAMDLAARMERRGWRVCLLSRGYRGRAEKRGAVVSDGRGLRVSAAEAGDEPYLMATRLPRVPVLVGRDRYAAGMHAVARLGCRAAVLDDGFQHLQLARDLDLLLLDARAPLGNGRLLPRGPLRETPRAAARSDAAVLVRRSPDAGPASVVPTALRGRPVLGLELRPRPAELITTVGREGAAAASAFLAGRRVAAFAGVAGNERFFAALPAFGAEPVRTLGFPDHHRYTAADLRRLRHAVRTAGAEALVTTAKDRARLAAVHHWDPPLVVIDLDVRWDDGGRGVEALLDGLAPAVEQGA